MIGVFLGPANRSFREAPLARGRRMTLTTKLPSPARIRLRVDDRARWSSTTSEDRRVPCRRPGSAFICPAPRVSRFWIPVCDRHGQPPWANHLSGKCVPVQGRFRALPTARSRGSSDEPSARAEGAEPVRELTRPSDDQYRNRRLRDSGGCTPQDGIARSSAPTAHDNELITVSLRVLRQRVRRPTREQDDPGLWDVGQGGGAPQGFPSSLHVCLCLRTAVVELVTVANVSRPIRVPRISAAL